MPSQRARDAANRAGNKPSYTDVNMDTSVEAGCVTYKIPLDHALCGNHVYTSIAAPAGAKSWRAAGNDDLHLLGNLQVNGTLVPGFTTSHYIWEFDQAETEILPIIWYADEAGTQVLKFERISWEIITGTPDPFPRYISGLTQVPKNRMYSVVWKNGESFSSLPYISATYAATESDFDTFRLAVTISA